jgi:hypothetical protein
LRIKNIANCFSAVVVEKSVLKCSLKVTVTLVTVYGTELEIHATTKTEKLFQKQLSSLDVEIYGLNPLRRNICSGSVKWYSRCLLPIS